MQSMLRTIVGVAVVWVTMGVGLAQDFTKTLTPEEFSGAGLDKLSPAELARLNELVRTKNSGEVARVKAETTAKVKAEVAASKPAESPSLVRRMKVVLTPGTDITYEKVETQLVGPFRGYDRGDVLTLANGQRWQVIEGTYWSPAKSANKVRKVVIEPGVLGSFFLNIEDGGRPKVKFVSNGN